MLTDPSSDIVGEVGPCAALARSILTTCGIKVTESDFGAAVAALWFAGPSSLPERQLDE
jgi:hypothetical protein